jgi:type I site-specific restriction endonuclease
MPSAPYRIRTQITQQGSTVEAGLFVDRRDRETRAVRWEKLDEDLTYDASVLDRDVVAMDQIRTVLCTLPTPPRRSAARPVRRLWWARCCNEPNTSTWARSWSD